MKKKMVFISDKKEMCLKLGKLLKVCRSLNNIMITADDNKFVNLHGIEHRYKL